MKAAFLDRDGVINKEVGYLHRVQDFEFTEDCLTGLKILTELDYSIIIVTNQAGIARGLYTEKQFLDLTSWLEDTLHLNDVNVLATKYCPHHKDALIEEYRQDCESRKPRPGMFINARDEFGITMKDSIVVGDKITDIYAARSAGVRNCFLVRSGHALPDNVPHDVGVFENLHTLAEFLVR